MRFKNLCIQPENELDERFIEAEMDFLIDISIKNQDKYRDSLEYAAVIKQQYLTWLYENRNNG